MAPPDRTDPGLPGWRHRARRQLVFDLKDPASLTGLALLGVFSWLIAAPLFVVLTDIFTSQPGDQLRTGVDAGEFTGYYLNRVFNSRMSQIIFWQPFWNTLAVASISMVLAVASGTTLAWLLVRTNLMGRAWLSIALIMPFMVPDWTFALAWTTLFKNATSGGLPGWFEGMGYQVPDWLAYGAFPTTLIMTLNHIPFVIILVGNAMQRLDSQMEEAARLLGASRLTIARRIVLPIIRPATLSVCLLTFADSIGEFSIPYVLGLPVGFDTLATSLYRAIDTQQNGIAAVFSGAIMAFGITILSIDTWMMRKTWRFAVMGNSGAIHRRHSLRALQLPTFAVTLALVVIGVALPLGVLLLSTMMHIPGRFSAENFTLGYWISTDLGTVALRKGILLSEQFWAAAWNSIRIIGSAAVFTGVIGLLVGYVVVRSPIRIISVALRQISFFPYLVPGIAFAAAFLVLFAVDRGPIPALYGTPWILFLALVADQMPFASRAGISAMTQLGREVEEAASMVGAGWMRRMRSIIFPIQRNALAAGILLSFISGLKGVSLFILLAIPSTDVLTTFSLRLVDYGYIQASNAVVLMISLIALLGTLVINRITGASLSHGLES